MRTHYLKTWVSEFEAVADGRKTFEFRYDQDFMVGDCLILQEWDPRWPSWAAIGHTGRKLVRYVTYVLHGGIGLGKHFVVLSLSERAPGDSEPKEATP